MPKSLSMAIRLSIIEDYRKGEKISYLSRKFKINRGTIRELIKRHKAEGVEGLRTKYECCGKKRPDEQDFVFRAVRCFRTWHPSWGAEKIRCELRLRDKKIPLPSVRTMNRWFHWNDQIAVSLKSSLPICENKKAKALHEVWQIDAKEEMIIGDGSKNCWLNIVDEYSGMVIQPPIFSQEEN